MADPLLDKTELCDCIKWLGKLPQCIQDLGSSTEPLTEMLARLRRTRIRFLVEINQTYSNVHVLSADDRRDIHNVFQRLELSMQNLHQAVSCRKSVDKDDLLLGILPLELADYVETLDEDLHQWLEDALDENHHEYSDERIVKIFDYLDFIKLRTDTVLEVADLISATPDTKDEPQTHS